MNAYVINRNDRPDRLATVTEELKKIGLNARRFEAIPGGWKGCRDSHLAILNAMGEGEQTLILEDDVYFTTPYVLDYLADAIESLGEEWDCIYLGGSPQEPQKRVSESLFRATNVLTTHAIVWNYRPYGAVEAIKEGSSIKKIDVFMAEVIQKEFNCYLMSPLLATQYQTQSNIARRSDVSTIEKNYNKFCI